MVAEILGKSGSNYIRLVSKAKEMLSPNFFKNYPSWIWKEGYQMKEMGNASWKNYCFLAGKELHYDVGPKRISRAFSFTEVKLQRLIILVEMHFNCLDPSLNKKAVWMLTHRFFPPLQNQWAHTVQSWNYNFTTIKWSVQKRSGGILTCLDSEVKVCSYVTWK